MNEEKELIEEKNDEPEIIIKKERPLLSLLKIMIFSVAFFVVTLFLIGMVLGFMGIRPPTFDPNVIDVPGTNKVTETEKPTTSPTSDTPSSNVTEGDAYEAGKEAGRLFKESKDDTEAFWRGFNEGQK